MALTRLSFPGATGARLDARLETPEGAAPRAYALFAHCFTCGKHSKAAAAVSRALAAQGIGVLRFDFTGLGESEGDFADTSFASNVDDLVAVADGMAAAGSPPTLLIGHSLGGAAALLAAGSIPSARAVVTIGAPSAPGHVARLLEAARPEIAAKGQAMVRIGERSFPISQAFLDSLAEAPLSEAVSDLGRALLICHAPADQIVNVDNAARLYRMARHPKSFFALDGADHLLTRREDSDYLAGMIAAWATRYLPAPPAAALEPAQAPAEGVEAVVGASGYTTSIRAGRHRLIADEPVSLGGADRGPNPYDLLLAGLGACTAITLRMYADRKGWPLEGVAVRLRHQKIHAADCADCETKEGRLDRIERELRLDGPLDQAQRARLLEMADRCPVHRTIHSEIHVRTTLVSD